MAIHSKRALEGYVMVDHRNSPGVPEAQIRQAGLPGMLVDAGRSVLFEAPTVTCSHCQQVFMVNPDRQRERGYCWKCDHYICDLCAVAMLTGECTPFARLADQIERAARMQDDAVKGTIWLPPSLEITDTPPALAAAASGE